MTTESGTLFRDAAWAILYIHALVVGFNVFWLVAIPIGAWQGWAFVRNFWWRIAHLASLAIVAGQIAAGQLCFLTVIQNSLLNRAGNPQPPSLFNRLMISMIYWPLPDWAFLPLYVLGFACTVLFWFFFPPRPRHSRSS